MAKKGKKRPGRDQREPDYFLILVAVALLLIGLLMVYSTTFDWGYLDRGDPFHHLKRQLMWVSLGGITAATLACIDYGYWQRWAVPLLAATLAVLVLLLVVGDWLWGARRAFTNGSIQPGELAKLATVIYAAAWASSKGDQIRDVTYGLIPFAIWMGGVAGLVTLQPDLSAVVILIMAGFAVFFLAGAHLGQLLVSGAVGGGVFWSMVALYPYAQRRIVEFIAGLQDPTILPYHPRQALYALASGGLLGTGLGAGREKFGYLPMAHNDTIFAALGEELGLIGCLLVIGLFALLAWRGFRIAVRAQDHFGSLLACGLTSLLVFQATLNIGAVTSLLPFTGTTLPFISLGGSSLGISMAAVGLLVSISRGRSRREQHVDEGVDRGGRNGRTRLSRSGRPTGT
ncbi:MAG: cell division protein FtsW [Anaerolineae bacterium]|nr:cell division protein FtsW [Anaerolineae bacterium]